MVNPYKLVHKALQANNAHQSALANYAESLALEIKELDNLLGTLEPGGEDDSECKLRFHVPGATRPSSIVPPNVLLKPVIEVNHLYDSCPTCFLQDSPFYHEASRRIRYNKYSSPHLMKGKEVEALVDAVQREEERLQTLERPDLPSGTGFDQLDWTRIAERVSTVSGVKRDANECRIKWNGYQHSCAGDSSLATQKVAVSRQRHVWSPEYNRKLEEAVRRYGYGNWNIVARSVSENVSASQCEGHYSRTLEPSVKRGPWSKEEDTRLHIAVEAYDHSWIEIASTIQGRTNDQCRERWLDLQKAAASMHARDKRLSKPALRE
ncbi:hypothetical protein AX17_000915 [Amanita inopinata Kibby_2008]|nr:hypothetical protein AX17_000915 [Amanita inopinata Kibby_2008]